MASSGADYSTGPTKIRRTVVRIHIKHATLAPMATPPAIPPRMALEAATDMISLKVLGGLLPPPSLDLGVVDDILVVLLFVMLLVMVVLCAEYSRIELNANKKKPSLSKKEMYSRSKRVSRTVE